MERVRIAPSYEKKWIETRPTPLSDSWLENMVDDVINGKLVKVPSNEIASKFINQFDNWIHSTKLNNLLGLDSFNYRDICSGCTQFIDNIYMSGAVQIIKGDYKYHWRLNNDIYYSVPGFLKPTRPLIIAMPFPRVGSPHVLMKEILDECVEKSVPVHIDGAWITCCRDIEFDFSHPAINSVGISLSKGLGLGWNRIAVRWCKEKPTDSISIMNEFNMLNKITLAVGSYYMENCQPDYLWNTHGESYYKVCKDFNLVPTNSIHLALTQDGVPRGISPLIRHLDG